MDGSRRSWVGLLMELAVVFAGVLGAFYAEDAWQQRDDDRRAQQTYSALLGELEAFTERSPVVVAEMTRLVEEWKTAHDAGDRPPAAYYREPRAEAPPTAIWEATLASGGVALLDPELFNSLAEYYNRVGSTSDRYARYNRFTEQNILPLLGGDSGAFYDDLGRLRGEYEFHMRFLAEIREELVSLSDEGAAVTAALRAAIR